VQVDQDWVVRRLARIADLDLRKLFAEDGTLRPSHELPEDMAGALKLRGNLGRELFEPTA
jgi:hypothetical protein